MLDNLTQRLGQGRQDLARPGAADRRQHRRDAARSAHGVAGSRRGAAGGQGVHRPRQGKGGWARGGRFPDAGPGAGGRGAPGIDRTHGRREGGPQSRHTAAGGDAHGRSCRVPARPPLPPSWASGSRSARRRRCWRSVATSIVRRLSNSSRWSRRRPVSISSRRRRARSPWILPWRRSTMPASTTTTSSSSIRRVAWPSTRR